MISVSRRTIILITQALLALVFSAILFSQPVNAIGVNTPIVIELQSNSAVIAQSSQLVAEKSTELQSISEEVNSITAKKEALSAAIDKLKSDLDSINSKIADKKARVAAEKARVAKLKSMFVHVNKYSYNAGGNLYAPGNCTWYVKQKRPDIGNTWGNANTWYSNAAAQGWNVGSTPKKGAVATTSSGYYGHVAYVEGVSLDGQSVTVSEMNYGGLYSMNTRTVHYSEFNYIYELD